MELWDIYDKNKEKTGGTIIRGENLKENQYHLVVHIWIVNSKGEFLIQRRAHSVERWPNMWAMTGGSAVAGEDSYTACMREMEEEIGIKPNMSNAELVFTVTRQNNFCDVWIIRQDFDLNQCKMQVEEVSEVKWATEKEIVELINKKVFVNYKYIEDLFELIKSSTS